jgi:hypothetical protein
MCPFIPDAVARSIFSSSVLGSDMSFETWWAEIEKFYITAKHFTNNTTPQKNVIYDLIFMFNF